MNKLNESRNASNSVRRLEGKVAIVTGASNGIGEATAKELGRLGASVVLVARKQEQLESIVASIEAAGGTAMQAEIPELLKSGGAIVNTASVGGLVGVPNLSPYVASKHAVVGLTKSVALEFATKGIRVNAIAPGVPRRR